jgi:hypothetical protein
MDNMKIYNQCKEVPKDAQKKIPAGRISGMTDINPQWRIEKLTEMFGPCGIGWKVKTVKKWIEEGANGEKAAFLDIELFIKVDGEWSEAIEGNGGASFVSKERNGMYTSDECYKMAKTDALSVACKMIGIGSDIYRGYNDSSKYANKNLGDNPNIQNKSNDKVTPPQLKRYYAIAKDKGFDIDYLDELIKIAYNIPTKNDWLKSDYDAFTKYMESNTMQNTHNVLLSKIKKAGKPVPGKK